jgi:hypothetical protein
VGLSTPAENHLPGRRHRGFAHPRWGFVGAPADELHLHRRRRDPGGHQHLVGRRRGGRHRDPRVPRRPVEHAQGDHPGAGQPAGLRAAADPGTPGGGGGGGGTGGLPKTPGEGQWIGTQTGQNKYNIGIGESTTAHVDHSLAEIAAGFTSQWYQLSSDKLWTICKVQIDAATTSSGTKYARCEHRELGLNGTDKAAWDGTTGEHRLKHISKIMHVPPNKSSVCFSQIHNASSDLVRW